MGAAASTNATISKQEMVNRVVSEAIVKTAMKCTANQSVDQTVDFFIQGSTVKDINILASMRADISCIQTSNSQADLQQNIKSALSSLAKQEAEAGPSLFSFSISTNISQQTQTLINDVSSSVQISTLLDSIANQTGKQVVNGKIIDSITGDVNISIDATVVMQAIQNSDTISRSITSLANQLDTESQQKAQSGLTMSAIIAIAVLLAISCCSGIVLFLNRDSSDDFRR